MARSGETERMSKRGSRIDDDELVRLAVVAPVGPAGPAAAAARDFVAFGTEELAMRLTSRIK